MYTYVMKDTSLRPAHSATPLTIAVLENCYYNDTDQSELINDILEEIFRSYASHCVPDDLTDFLLLFRARISRMITRYEFYGVPFEHYLMHAVRLYLAKYRYQQHKRNYYLASSARYNSDLPPVEKESLPVDIFPLMLDMVGVPAKGSPPPSLNSVQRKRLMIIACKLVHWLTADHVSRVADITRHDHEQLLLLLETVRVHTADRFARHGIYAERRNQLYAQLMQEYCDIQYTGGQSHEPSVLHERAYTDDGSRLPVLRQRLQNYNRRISHARVIPTNQLIATVLNIPKGTVDTTLAILKRRYARLSNADSMDYASIDDDNYRYK